MIFIGEGGGVVEGGVFYDFRGGLAYSVISHEYFF